MAVGSIAVAAAVKVRPDRVVPRDTVADPDPAPDKTGGSLSLVEEDLLLDDVVGCMKDGDTDADAAGVDSGGLDDFPAMMASNDVYPAIKVWLWIY